MTDMNEWQIRNLSGDVIWTGKGKNLRGANLYEANLRGADLYGADLRGADLRGADLRGANLYGANLCGANLCGADLRGADLCGANLCGANLRGADLRGADLRGANLCGANLCDANLCGANLRGANLGALILLARATRLDGHEYFAWTSVFGGMVITAGCRTWIGEDAIQQARLHCETRTAPEYRAEALRIVAYIEAAWNEHTDGGRRAREALGGV